MRRLALTLFVLQAALALAEPLDPLRFSVTWDAALYRGPFSGRVVIYFGKGTGEPRFGPDWLKPQPIASSQFKAVRPGEQMLITDANCIGFPSKLGALAAGKYTVQAVIDRNLGGRAIGESPGNLYSNPVELTLDPTTSGKVAIRCDQVVPEPKFVNTRHVREVSVLSSLLSKWYGRPTRVSGAVMLPEAYFKEPKRRFPILYVVPGFGGNHYQMSGKDQGGGNLVDGEPFIQVALNPDCPTGHCVFADSANNGPWGAALVTEFIPRLEKQYRSYNDAGARYVGGHSSGGWSSLWLQITYPNVFGGVWSTSPDPVDFRNFQYIDLYKPGTNMFVDERGERRPLARFGLKPMLYYKPFSDMERPIRGEQLGSFEAVFSPKGPGGEPMKLWDRDTGAIDTKVALAWERYDIDLILRRHWKSLGPKLAGKLHVYTGSEDTFYLEGAVKLLATDLKALGSDAKVELFPGDHMTVMTAALRKRMDHEMAERFRHWRARHGKARAAA
ncbi:MAG: hypothetical protein HYR64_10655 [Fimbriimonas ginsengisoli]|uniref:Enterochelin esterase n=1 Tax=Fimbriimonas ginsengisoli TaxID=1005039 RepID=A0A931LXD6_FIMGI|nr:hypothetical protein [Fimbriimonas ginsengisoli]